ncbi:hypothetical protein EXIGLDRAFT_721379 [Exidia glandulosa HHB12029]|uniref:Uncharacterized protein n=1 Tax=Exidia glandulosa HHB12029 TaxID=1314781 RepID=A0A165FTD2_EXIGL|nr:hypothetical protein EXIGLDRAFT_721379 [Exidia glandulosa HHB12029]
MAPRLPHDVLRLVIEQATEQDSISARIVRLVSRTTAAWAGPFTLLVTARNQARIFDASVDYAVRRRFAAHVGYLIIGYGVRYIGPDSTDEYFDTQSLLPPRNAAVSMLAPFVHIKRVGCAAPVFWALSTFADFHPEHWFLTNQSLARYDVSGCSIASLLRVHIVDYSKPVQSYAKLYTSATHIFFEPLDRMDGGAISRFVATVSALLALPTCQRLLIRVSGTDTPSYAVRALAALEDAIVDSRIFVDDTFSRFRDLDKEALADAARWHYGVPLRERTFTARDADAAPAALSAV